MKKALVIMLLAGAGCWFSSYPDDAAAQGRRGGEKTAPAPQPAPAARTPSLSPSPAPQRIVAPRPVPVARTQAPAPVPAPPRVVAPRPVPIVRAPAPALPPAPRVAAPTAMQANKAPLPIPAPTPPRVNPPAMVAQQHIQLPSNFPRSNPQPVPPRPLATIPKKQVINQPQPKAQRLAPVIADHRPGLVPGSSHLVPEHRPARQDVTRFRDLPREQAVTRPIRSGALVVPAAELNRKLNDAWARRPREDNPGRDRVEKFHQHAVAVRDHLERNYRADPWFSRTWWNTHNNERRPWWNYTNYWGNRPYTYWWRPATWGLATGWLTGNWGQPIYYDYGTNVVYRDNYVYVNDVPVAPADVYASQAIDLASAAPPPEGAPIDWMPLGTFGLAGTQDNIQSDVVLQLAISRDGLVSGTSYNSRNQQENTVEGRVDPATQRLAIHFGDDPNIVLETGLYNLTQESSPVLIHFGTLTTQTWFLVRLQAPDQAGAQ